MACTVMLNRAIFNSFFVCWRMSFFLVVFNFYAFLFYSIFGRRTKITWNWTSKNVRQKKQIVLRALSNVWIEKNIHAGIWMQIDWKSSAKFTELILWEKRVRILWSNGKIAANIWSYFFLWPLNSFCVCVTNEIYDLIIMIRPNLRSERESLRSILIWNLTKTKTENEQLRWYQQTHKQNIETMTNSKKKMKGTQ